MQWSNIVGDLVWPITVLVVMFFLRRDLPSIIDNILPRLKKIKHGDTELEFISREANESLAKVAHGGYVGAINIQAIFETVKLNEWATLVISRMLMRKGLVTIVGPDHGFGDSPSLEKLLKCCEDRKALPLALIDELKRLREVTFFAEWWSGRVPLKSEWMWALDNCERIVKALFDYQVVA